MFFEKLEFVSKCSESFYRVLIGRCMNHNLERRHIYIMKIYLFPTIEFLDSNYKRVKK